ncbi:uncharacterized protein [Triticum aestivum]|uniref:uncharacterized protein n=1 Tax=Triticum aestivum TaxID=4565 RepID=UPI001D0143CE|nr:uncharacterized protein LOC123113097 [Triticum aestivum]
MGASADYQCATAQCNQDDASVQHHGSAAWCESSPCHERPDCCRQMSNYMAYLLFVNPEMLMAGTRRFLLNTANDKLEDILKPDKPSLKKILKSDKPSLKEIFQRDISMLDIIKGQMSKVKQILNGNISMLKQILTRKTTILEITNYKMSEILKIEKEIEGGIMQILISRMELAERKKQVAEVVGSAKLPPNRQKNPATQERFIHDAWEISKVLLALGDEKMWEVIEGVWVEMLCFSASNCRGYLHAKSLGTGIELLTYVWLLLSHMGMETLPERLQRTEPSSGEVNAGAAPSTSQTPGSKDPPPFRRSRPREAAAAASTSTCRPQEIQPAE